MINNLPFPYIIECINPELEIYTVLNTKNHNHYQLIKNHENGGFDHAPRCKALEVRGDNFMCRHKLIILKKFYANEKYKHLFNISPKRNKV